MHCLNCLICSLRVFYRNCLAAATKRSRRRSWKLRGRSGIPDRDVGAVTGVPHPYFGPFRIEPEENRSKYAPNGYCTGSRNWLLRLFRTPSGMVYGNLDAVLFKEYKLLFGFAAILCRQHCNESDPRAVTGTSARKL